MNGLAEKIRIDFRSDEPLYLQVTRQVEQLVISGRLAVGDQLPTVRELATELRINFNTVSRAYRLLDESGLISTQRGRGTYIWEKPTEESLEQLKGITLQELALRYLEQAVRLGFSYGEAAVMLDQCINKEPPVEGNSRTNNEKECVK